MDGTLLDGLQITSFLKSADHMKITREVCQIQGFTIFESRRYKDGKPVKIVFNIRNRKGQIVVSDYQNFNDAVKLLFDLIEHDALKTDILMSDLQCVDTPVQKNELG